MANLPTIKISKNKFPLRRKLIISYFLFFLIILNSFLYLPISYHYSSLFFREFLKENQKLDLLSKELQTLLFYTETYISNNKTTDLIQLNNTINKIKIIINTNFYKYEDLSYIIKDIIATVRTTIETANPNFLVNYNNLKDKVNLSHKYINSLIINNNTTLIDKYQKINNSIKSIEKKALIVSIITAISLIGFLIYFSINITKPLNKIIKNAKLLSAGHFDIEPIKVKTKDELRTIADVFNQMVSNIRKLIKELKDRLELERELQKEKVENLRIKNLLREAEFKQLQAQINPHFLYNTLNTITQVAILEEAQNTGNLIKKTANLLRYNLKKGNELVKLKDEIKTIKLYFEIMKIRFADKLEFKLSFPEKLGNIYIPAMLLQPLIENALIHGLNNTKKIGLILLKIDLDGDFLKIIVIDNGKGISSEKIDLILSTENKKPSGLVNIKERLEFYYQRDDLLKIISKLGYFTKIIVKIPIHKGGKKNV